MIKEFPKTLYRANSAGGVDHRSFASEADLVEGWVSHGEAKAEAAKIAPAPKAVAPTPNLKGDAAKVKALEALVETRNKELKIALEGEKKANAEADALDETLTKANTIIEGLQKKVAELESAAKAEVKPGATEAKPAPSAKPKAAPKA